MTLRFRGCLFQALGRHGSRVERHFDVPWTMAGVSSILPERVCLDKYGVQLWTPAQYREGATRGNAGLLHLYGAALDKDCGDVGELDAVCAHLDAQGLAYIVYSSWSHAAAEKTPNDQPSKPGPFDCFRVVLPYSRQVSPDEHRVLVPSLFGYEVLPDPPEYAAEVRGVWLKTPSGAERAARPRGWDPASSRPSQPWFVPACPPHRATHAVMDVREGRPLDVDAIFATPHRTAPVVARRERQYHRPTVAAAGAMHDISTALEAIGYGFGPPTYEAWQRSMCPSCNDKSPSLRARANGDGIDVHCFAGCKRTEILKALGLNERGRFRAPTHLEERLEEQLGRQTVDHAVPIHIASARLLEDLREAVLAREPTILKYPAGTGKSWASAQIITERVRAGFRIASSTQEHAVAAETMRLLPPDVLAQALHIHSPLVQVGDSAVCRRADEVREPVFEYGASLMREVCPKCPHRDGCQALADARARYKRAESARALFVSHAGIGQVFGEGRDGVVKGMDTELIVDEMPGTYEQLIAQPDTMRMLAPDRLKSAQPLPARAACEIARAWLAGETPGEVRWTPSSPSMGNALEIAAELGRLVIRTDVPPLPYERPYLECADAVLRLAAHHAAGGAVSGLDAAGRLPFSAMLPDAAHRALLDRRGVLLSATPMMAALHAFTLKECHVEDGAPVRRVMVLRAQRGSSALTEAYHDPVADQWTIRDPAPGEGPGIPWPLVDDAIARSLAEAAKYNPPRVLFVTFKAIADALRADPTRQHGGLVDYAHFGAVRGKNQWQERATNEVSVVYLFGTPRFNIKPTLEELGLVGEAADQAWVDYAAGELTQAEGRLRLPRRTKPCTVFVEGDVAPSTWTVENIDTIDIEELDLAD